jgi:hypothetical protein
LGYYAMRKFIPLKFVSRLLLMSILLVAVNGVFASSHSMQSCLSAAMDSAITRVESSAPHVYPSAPPEQHDDYDNCDTCIGCPCHASLVAQQLLHNYTPFVLSLRLSDPYQYIPEVFLSKFIPPQNLA